MALINRLVRSTRWVSGSRGFGRGLFVGADAYAGEVISPVLSSARAAEELLHDLPGRLAHVAGVAEHARAVSEALAVDQDVVVAAAWLHDIGYAPQVAATGFHPLDGARFATKAGYPPAVTSLIAYHSSAEIEAVERELYAELAAEFNPPEAESLAVLTYCDMTVGPRGERMTIDERLADILERYDPDEVVYRSIQRSARELRSTVAYVEKLLADQSQ